MRRTELILSSTTDLPMSDATEGSWHGKGSIVDWLEETITSNGVVYNSVRDRLSEAVWRQATEVIWDGAYRDECTFIYNAIQETIYGNATWLSDRLTEAPGTW